MNYCTRCGHWAALTGWLCAGCHAAWITRHQARHPAPRDPGLAA